MRVADVYGRLTEMATSKSERTGWAVLGASSTARKQTTPAILGVGHDILAVGTRAPSTLTASGDLPDGALALTPEEAIQVPGGECVYISLPNAHHFRSIVSSPNRGLDVLCEKPLVLSINELAQVEEALDNSKSTLTENYSHHHSPAYQRLKLAVSNGRFGRLRGIKAVFSFPSVRDSHENRFDWQLGGGSFSDLGCYGVDLIHRLFEQPISIESVSALAPGPDRRDWGNGPELPVDGSCVVSGKIADDICVENTTSLECGSAQHLSVVGDTGKAEINPPFKVELETIEYREVTDGKPFVASYPLIDPDQAVIEEFVRNRTTSRSEHERIRWDWNARTMEKVRTQISEQLGTVNA